MPGGDNKALAHSGSNFSRLKETWQSVPIPAAEVLLEVLVSPGVLTEGKGEGPAAGMTISGHRNPWGWE